MLTTLLDYLVGNVTCILFCSFTEIDFRNHALMHSVADNVDISICERSRQMSACSITQDFTLSFSAHISNYFASSTSKFHNLEYLCDCVGRASIQEN